MSSNIVKALAHPLRLKILEYIDNKGSINVNKIYTALKIEQSITSQHLRVLRMAGIVHSDKEGKYVHYTIDYPTIEKTVKALKNFYTI